MESRKIAIILLGPPGSGKTTQAQRLSEEFDLVHFNTGEVIKDTINDPANQNDSEIQHEKQLYESGFLGDDRWVTNLVIKETKKIENSGKGVVYSGSPRRLMEAEGLMPALDDFYGEENVFIFYIPLSFEEAVARIKSRRLCSVCGHPLMADDKSEVCPKCGGEIIVRTLDDPEKLKLRFEEYHKKTEPILNYYKSINAEVYEIRGEDSPDNIHEKIKAIIKSKLR